MDLFARAAHYSACAHRDQRRKSADAAPYINHPLEVASLLAGLGKVTDVDVLCAGLLHDVVEDTAVTEEDLRRDFGERIAGIVRECSDDKSLSKALRKEAQVTHAPHASPEAKLVKLADKLSNLRGLLQPQGFPVGWSTGRVREYFAWSARVVEGLRGVNSLLEAALDEVLARGGATVLPGESEGGGGGGVGGRNSSSLEDFYGDTEPPSDLAFVDLSLREFFAFHCAAGRRTALVTSGGTMVPLEARMVRFVDNFSTGLRGASLAEGLLAAGYAVVFLHRAGSKRPQLHKVLDALAEGMSSLHAVNIGAVDEAWRVGVEARVPCGDSEGLAAGGSSTDPFMAYFTAGHEAVNRVGSIPALELPPASPPLLLEVTFSSVQDYLFKLRAGALACRSSSASLPSPHPDAQSEYFVLACL
jgi:hypothetical protein